MINEKAEKIELLILDVDGVLTDGRIIMNDLGQETKYFNVKDGHGLRLLMSAGIDVAIITGRESEVVKQRAADLGIEILFQGIKDKESVCRSLIEEKGLANVARLPFSIKILVENLIRKLDGDVVLEKDVINIANWKERYDSPVEIPYHPARVLMQVRLLAAAPRQPCLVRRALPIS